MNAKELIKSLGGPTKVAEMLGYEQNGTQRVSNWMKRGIPPAVQLMYPQLRTGNERRRLRKGGKTSEKSA